MGDNKELPGIPEKVLRAMRKEVAEDSEVVEHGRRKGGEE